MKIKHEEVKDANNMSKMMIMRVRMGRAHTLDWHWAEPANVHSFVGVVPSYPITPR